ncbi:MAG TPA: tetratricopeptide repeat protein [Thermoanaerobaculia bacterium]|jgi:tol-pal system protein YbgF
MRVTVAATALLVLTAACASNDDGPVVAPPGAVASPPVASLPSASDARLAEMQTQLTELLERLDVMNDRIGRMESAAVAAPAASSASTGSTASTTTASPAAPSPRRVPIPATPAEAAPPQAAIVAAKIADDYRSAIMLYGRGRVADSRRAFQEVYEADPAGDLADNALFWIGETYFGAADYQNALRYYARVTNEFAQENKAPDALFKTALALARTGDLALARKTLNEVIARYPYSTPAASAKHELERLKY